MMMMIQNYNKNRHRVLSSSSSFLSSILLSLVGLLLISNNNKDGVASASTADDVSGGREDIDVDFDFDCNNQVEINEYENAWKKQHHFQLSSSGLYLTSNRGFQYVYDDLSNMIKYWSRQSMARLNAWHKAVQSQAFSYVDTYNDHYVNTNCLPKSFLHNNKSNIWKVIPWNVSFYLDDKLTFGHVAKSSGLEGKFIPRTFETKQEAMKALLLVNDKNDNDKNDNDNNNDNNDNNEGIFFLKDRFGTKGMGITIHSINELSTIDVPRWSIIQEGITENLALYENKKKLTGRLFVIIFKGCVYIHHSGTIKVQHNEYDASSTNENTQVSHDGHADPYIINLYNNDDSDDEVGGVGVVVPPDFHLPFLDRMSPPVRNWGPKFDKSKVINSSLWLDSFIHMTKAMSSRSEFLKPIIDYTIDVDPMSYSILGIDVIPMIDGSLQMIEINHYPNFYRFDIMTDIILTMFQMNGNVDVDQQLSKRLIKVWDYYSSEDNDDDDDEFSTTTTTTTATTSSSTTITTTTITNTNNSSSIEKKKEKEEDDNIMSSSTTTTKVNNVSSVLDDNYYNNNSSFDNNNVVVVNNKQEDHTNDDPATTKTCIIEEN